MSIFGNADTVGREKEMQKRRCDIKNGMGPMWVYFTYFPFFHLESLIFHRQIHREGKGVGGKMNGDGNKEGKGEGKKRDGDGN